jgi:hypothetical protein
LATRQPASEPVPKSKRAATKPNKSTRSKLEQAPTSRSYFRQTDFPQVSLQEAEKIASALIDNFGGREGSPPDIALSLGISPTSSAWPVISGAAIAYGITEGGVNASAMKLTELGRKLVAPEQEGEDLEARRQATLLPRICREFFNRYRRSKFPSQPIVGNVIRSFGVPANRIEKSIEILLANGRYSGVIRDTPTGPFVNLDSPRIPEPAATPAPSELPGADVQPANPRDSSASFTEEHRGPVVDVSFRTGATARRVFISHGKHRSIVNQIKELLIYGKFEPIVSVERETVAIPVPEKVFEDMRSCGAGVIHVGSEGTYTDKEGAEHTKINDNVLIEIGAAMALYGRKIVLLVEKGVSLPSNLQGLYRCELENGHLDYTATMKLLKTFTQFS